MYSKVPEEFDRYRIVHTVQYIMVISFICVIFLVVFRVLYAFKLFQCFKLQNSSSNVIKYNIHQQCCQSLSGFIRIVHSGWGSSFEFSEFWIQAKVMDPCGSGSATLPTGIHLCQSLPGFIRIVHSESGSSFEFSQF